MKTAERRTVFGLGTVLLGAAILAGCTNTQQTPNQTVRSTYDTAPADLQLACANEAAPIYGVGAETVLPISSKRTQDNLYTVTLDVNNGRQALCTIDSDGNVVAITDA
ncbi:hypothetical protein HW532_16835 [Kaustia mangrovi]|uniref:Uncharacterized protein n=1 Tax=Kaustia mangrovi TaxID=2593653 RepID=A0A7S8C6D5_9HYPH|nr:hypothetical protein [Kaustia mangrovi]QPC44214.1 hypothetical protein HW532_16835 [Kaustia mangrovi]